MDLNRPQKAIKAFSSKISKVWYVLFALVLTCSLLWAAETPDYDREARLAEEAEAGLFDGEIVYLKGEDDRKFLGLLSEYDEPGMDGAVIILHGRGFHPDWPLVAGPLREGLGELSIPTLSLQMPVLEKDAKYYDYLGIIPDSFARITAGIEFLTSKGYEWVALVAHSCSVHMSMAWIKEFGDDDIDAYVGIGMGATDYKQPMLKPFPLRKISVPILDVFGSNDYPAVLKAAVDRKQAITAAGNSYSSQNIIEGPDHFFEDYESELVDEIATWISQIPK